jgi:hypothetical protein
VRAIHNVQQDETMDNMGNRIPMIYASMENKQVEFKSHMFEVEGMINSHTFVNIMVAAGGIYPHV